MAETNNADPDDLARRLTELEMLYMHLQRTVEDLSGVLIEQQRREEVLRGELRRMQARMELLEADPEVRSPEEEKPPHY